MARKDKRFWLSVEMGFLSDADKLYEWLDRHEAKECGQNIATFRSELAREELVKELLGLVDKECRLYLIDRTAGGRFILGKRKRRAPWDGYAKVMADTDDAA
jgi:hypothetical protein